jgi:hypothetical protein
MFKKIKYVSVFALLLLAFAACEQANDKNPVLLGKWQGTEWLIFGEPSGQDATKVRFEFLNDGNYTAGFGTQTESGSWRTVDDKLYTQATGRKEIMVKIIRLDSIVLKFEMNRAGQEETIVLNKVH